jgi:hypothetical protein
VEDDDDEVELLRCSGISEQTEELKCSSLHEALSKLSLKTQPETEKEIQFFVQRRHVLKNAFVDVKTSKMMTSKVSVEFIGEPAVDTGGPTKEMFSIAFRQSIDCKLTRGAFPYITFLHDQNALVGGYYKVFGQLVALSLLNGAGGPHILSSCLANFILGTENKCIGEEVMNEIPADQAEIVTKLQSLNACTTPDEWAKAVMSFEERFDMGINKATVPFEEKEELIKAAAKHIMISSALEEIYSFKEGLSTFGVLNVLKQHPEEAYKELTYMQLSVEDVRKPFVPMFSVRGSSKREKEELVVFNYNQFLKKCSQGEVCKTVLNLDGILGEQLFEEEVSQILTLNDVYQFATGLRYPPPGGCKGAIEFMHDTLPGTRAKANTCANSFSFPINDRYASEDSGVFVSNFADDIFEAPGYGFV